MSRPYRRGWGGGRVHSHLAYESENPGIHRGCTKHLQLMDEGIGVPQGLRRREEDG